MLFVMRQLQEVELASNVPLNMWFIDLQETYDSGDHTLLWELLVWFGVPPQMIRIVLMFHSMRARVPLENGKLSA